MKPIQTPGWESIETTSREELSTLQEKRLKQTLGKAYENISHNSKDFLKKME